MSKPVPKSIDDLPCRHIRNLRQYSEIWGEDCPSNELPDLIVFRPDDLNQLIEWILGENEHFVTPSTNRRTFNDINRYSRQALKNEQRNRLSQAMKGKK